MKLLVLNDELAFRKGGDYFWRTTFSLFAVRLASYFEEVVILSPISSAVPRGNHLVSIPLKHMRGVRIEPTYPYSHVVDYYLKLPKILASNIPIYSRAVQWSDAIYLRIPSANAAIVAAMAYRYHKPMVTHVAGDERETVRQGRKYRGWKRPFALLMANLHESLYKAYVSRSQATIFLSQELRDRLAGPSGREKDNTYTMFVSLVEESEPHPQIGIPPTGDPIRMIYVGRLAHNKGIDYLLQAVDRLHGEGISFNLSLCGDGLPGDRPYIARLREFVRERRLEPFVQFCGFVPWGQAQWDLYREAHVFVLPSICGEGIPKVLLEAMSRGVPIVATSVCGVPDIIQSMENGILIPPRSPESIASAVKLLTRDREARSKIITNGLRFAEQHTLENQAERFAHIIYKHAGKGAEGTREA